MMLMAVRFAAYISVSGPIVSFRWVPIFTTMAVNEGQLQNRFDSTPALLVTYIPNTVPPTCCQRRVSFIGQCPVRRSLAEFR